ncbi:uncharacterized protein METZ01_LOCUS274898 [marine metagenome]|uniref:Uncharacterized protein n=1 Tax=marine metagenome TaxID=408172 RepID=A0A382KAS3_9ZZZZ
MTDLRSELADYKSGCDNYYGNGFFY